MWKFEAIACSSLAVLLFVTTSSCLSHDDITQSDKITCVCLTNDSVVLSGACIGDVVREAKSGDCFPFTEQFEQCPFHVSERNDEQQLFLEVVVKNDSSVVSGWIDAAYTRADEHSCIIVPVVLVEDGTNTPRTVTDINVVTTHNNSEDVVDPACWALDNANEIMNLFDLLGLDVTDDFYELTAECVDK